MAKGEQYKSRASEAGLGAGKAHRVGNSYRGTPRTQSDYSKNSAKAYNPIQSGKYGSGRLPTPGDVGKLAIGGSSPGCTYHGSPERKSETGAQYNKRMARHFE